MKNAVLSVAVMLAVAGCGGSGSDGGVGSTQAPAQCDNLSQKQFVWDVLNDSYLWADKMPATVNLASYNSPEDVLQQLRYQPSDRYSFIMSESDYNNFFEAGIAIGLGYSSVVNDAQDGYQVRYVYEGSPAWQLGLRRGDLITHLNDRPAEDIARALADGNQTWDDIIGPKNAGISVAIRWQTPAGENLNGTAVKAELVTNTVHGSQIIETAVGKVGYFAFTAFTEPAAAELERTFAELSAAGIDELVVDLRYNGGGRTSTANRLSSEIGQEHTRGQIFTHFEHNAAYRHQDSQVEFLAALSSLELSRVTVLTTEESCSASEMTINALRPFMEVVTIGGTTCGKPIGMYNHAFCGKVLLPIEFQVTNALRQGDYFDGLPATCAASDIPVQRWGSRDDALLSEALHYLDTGSCSQSARAARPAASPAVIDLNPLRHHF